MSMQRRAAAFLTRALVKARLASLGGSACRCVEIGPWGAAFQRGGSPASGVTTTKPRAGPFSSSWLTMAWATSFEGAPWKLRMSGSGRLAVGSDGTAKRYSRGVPATLSVSVVVPAAVGDPQPDEPLRALCVPWEVTELVALAGVAREAVTTRAAPNTNIRAPRVL